jgi:hypothetical protein
MQLQYLETLKQIGNSSSTKIVLPMELASLVSRLRGTLDTGVNDRMDLESPSRNGEPV